MGLLNNYFEIFKIVTKDKRMREANHFNGQKTPNGKILLSELEKHFLLISQNISIEKLVFLFTYNYPTEYPLALYFLASSPSLPAKFLF